MEFLQEVRSAADSISELKNCKADESIYQEWIAAYHSEWFSTLVEEQMTRLDEIAEADRNRMKEHFIISSPYEHSFWEMAYHLETWPIETHLRSEQK